MSIAELAERHSPPTTKLPLRCDGCSDAKANAAPYDVDKFTSNFCADCIIHHIHVTFCEIRLGVVSAAYPRITKYNIWLLAL